MGHLNPQLGANPHVGNPVTIEEIAPVNRRQGLVVLCFHVAFLLWSIFTPARVAIVSLINQGLVVTMAIGGLVVVSGAIFELEHPTFSPKQRSHALALRRGVILMGLTVMLNAIHAVHKAYLALGDVRPTYPNPAELWQIPALLATIAAMYVMPGLRCARGTRNRIFFDQLIFASAVGALAWYFVLGPTLRLHPDGQTRILFGASMVMLHVISLSSCLALTSQFRLPILNRAKACLFASVSLGLVAELMGFLGVLSGSDPSVVIGIDVARSLSFVMLAWAARFWARLDQRDADRTEAHVLWWRQIVSYGPVVPAFGVTCLVVWRGVGGIIAQGIYPCAFFMMIVIFLRQVSVLRDNARLTNRLQDALEQVEAKNAEVYEYVQQLETSALSLAQTRHELEDSYRTLQDKNRQTEQYAQQLRQAMESVEAKNRQVVGYARQVESANGKLIDMQTVLSKSLAEVEVMRIDLEKSNDGLMAANQMLLHSASVDGMTGLLNHGTFQERLAEVCGQYLRHQQPFSMLLIDVDHFKSYNDAFGHPAGDEALKLVASILRENVRSSDIVARYGGEEFAVLLRNTSFMHGYAAAERIRQIVEDTAFPKRNVSVSIGVAGPEVAEGGPADVVSNADAALYVSKHLGRNRATVYEYIEWQEDAIGISQSAAA